jgi:hypothetical protein
MLTLTTVSTVVSVIMGTLVACGAVGSPVSPESVGVTPTIERQKQIEALEETQRKASATVEPSESQPDPILQGQDVDLPPLQPVGIR